jgi:hypothetical protein
MLWVAVRQISEVVHVVHEPKRSFERHQRTTSNCYAAERRPDGTRFKREAGRLPVTEIWLVSVGGGACSDGSHCKLHFRSIANANIFSIGL